ncbi:TldD/PmbA family protein [Neoroseomonas oryzicola]|uniref:TldD/PmbA family protein n=1 Tax=Neoroseomonas oryzicola TaxID=535904 RepID=A0A9X9WLT9_9PROT|nr:TldD/PmbA family protein [Neoroseomonas oryzicola]MBR0661299.1 TldD/PmbA family protein [Neoroseomonas oryzicola]NKE19137.1 TldD/PmbA family protein [Neoroseomonas oryzicola]
MDRLSTLSDLIAAAKRAGADAADAVLVASTALSVKRRLGAIEQLERAEGFDIGLRVFVGKRQAIVSSNDPDPRSFAALAERTVAMARVVPEDPFAGLADLVTIPPVDLDLEDPVEPSAESLLERAAAAEEAALAVKGVTNSEGADASWGRFEIALVASTGLAGGYVRSSHTISATALAGSGTGMERDYDWGSTVYLSDLEDPAAIGRRAGEQAVRRLNPTRPKTARLPVVYDPRVSGSLLGHLSGAINGASVARGTSFLKDRMGQQVLAAGLTVRDDPFRRRGLRSRPFDGEGMPGEARDIVADGVLTTWFMDWRSARQLGLASTGHAVRGTAGPPGAAPSNLWLLPGKATPAELMADIREGLYVTEMMGSSINGLTGDYSRGAAGFMIRDGQLAEPVSEVTVAGNLKDMFLNMTPADDLRFRTGMDCPTLRIEGLTMAGS